MPIASPHQKSLARNAEIDDLKVQLINAQKSAGDAKYEKIEGKACSQKL